MRRARSNFEILINNRYSIKKKIGKGSFGEVHMGIDKITGLPVAIKLEHQTNKPMLQHEYAVYQQIRSPTGRIPKVFWFGKEGEYRVMVLEYLGDSVESLFNHCGRKFSLKTTLQIGIQIFDLLEHLHRHNFIHRDLKPENFLIGTGNNRNYIYMIDFGLAKRFKNNNKVHMNISSGKKLVGTARYASVNSHNGIELSRRDDMESLVYLMIYFLKGILPWQGLPGNTREEKYEAIKQHKNHMNIATLCTGVPEEFYHFLTHVRSLDFKEKPNYSYLRTLLFNISRKHQIKLDYHYDWSNDSCS